MRGEDIVCIARKAIERDKAMREEQCARELAELLERHGCKLEARPEQVAGLWHFRVLVEAK